MTLIQSVFLRRLTVALAVGVAVVCALGGCGRGAPATQSAQAESADPPAGGAVNPCGLLTAEQVATVLADSDKGDLTHSGGSLIAGVDAYECAYTNADASQVFTIVLDIAADDERFAKIRPSKFAMKDERGIDIGDAAWVYGDGDDDLKLKVLHGHTMIDLELLGPGAHAKSEQVIALGRAVTAKL
jgi:hypothetical protein